jgi:23S rRNA G2069 N7-methylase RlmK/C1962 C5-methylase RlmI
MIIYRDDNWLVVDKPEGLATHAGAPGELGAVEWIALHLGIKTHVVSRLDRGTSGVLLLALHREASARAQVIHESDEAIKVYEFISHQCSPEEKWICEEPLDGKSATTRFTRLSEEEMDAGPQGLVRIYRYRARISRGRKHQVRRHAAFGGAPILGDVAHGGRAFPRICLHCSQVRWPDITQPLTSELPLSFRAISRGDGSASRLGLALCRDRRGEWLAQITNAFRVVHRGEIASLPASVDVFGDYFSAVWYDQTADPRKAANRLDPVLKQIMLAYKLRGGVVRNHQRNPHEKSLVATVRPLGEEPPEVFEVHEHGLRYQVNLQLTQHTGLFLDQRDTRRRLMQIAAGKRVTNLFAFTCSFAVVAAAAGCEVVFSLDTAKACLNTGKANFALNDLAETGRGKFIQEDARKWIDRQTRKLDEQPDTTPRWDLVVCDPPVFASSKDGGQFSVEKEWPWLAENLAAILAEDGQALFANNHRGGKHQFYRNSLEKHFAEVIDLRPPLDFPVAEGRPHHVRMFWCRKTASA